MSAQTLRLMEMHNYNEENQLDNPADIELNKPSKSRFLFLLFFFGIFIFAWAGCYNLYEHGYESNKDVEVPDNTKYNPTYK
ncbi:MAG TPA: hypothetical protein VIN07_11895 [Flavipsychrobacter sp.]